ncbi:MAG TPA: DUF3025 domain-containing protein [Luteibacter sp.]|nr:DUF3025 domain-containing protein [Luteibacter sp.]
MRYLAPPRESIDGSVFTVPPLVDWKEYASLLEGVDWPSIDDLNALLPAHAVPRFAVQDPSLIGDGLHYEERVAMRGVVATRESNWHDLLNALVWLRHAPIKRAVNARQVAEITRMGRKERSRPQCAITHFDEGGVVVVLRDSSLLPLWDAHDWHGLFWHRRDAWIDGRATVHVFGHALLEHALTPGKLMAAKALVFVGYSDVAALALCAEAIVDGRLLNDPQDLRPLPLSGIPGWHARTGDEAFYLEAECFRPLREGRLYPEPLAPRRSGPVGHRDDAETHTPCR